MSKFMQTILRKMSGCITSFWVVEENPNRKNTSYPDYPVSPFGPTRLISKETIKELVKRN